MIQNRILILLFCVCLNNFINHAQTADNWITQTELKLHDGSSVKIADLKGKVVVLDFWYRSCMPCLQAIPELIKIQEDYKNEVVIIGINDIDDQEDVTDYLNYKKANYLSTFKTKESISQRLKINSFPTLYVFDREGKLAGVELGYQRGMRNLKKLIKDALK